MMSESLNQTSGPTHQDGAVTSAKGQPPDDQFITLPDGTRIRTLSVGPVLEDVLGKAGENAKLAADVKMPERREKTQASIIDAGSTADPRPGGASPFEILPPRKIERHDSNGARKPEPRRPVRTLGGSDVASRGMSPPPSSAREDARRLETVRQLLAVLNAQRDWLSHTQLERFGRAHERLVDALLGEMEAQLLHFPAIDECRIRNADGSTHVGIDRHAPGPKEQP